MFEIVCKRISQLLSLLILFCVIYYSVSLSLSWQISVPLIVFSLLTCLIMILLIQDYVVLRYCLSMFTLLVAWRITALSQPSLPEYILWLFGLLFFLKFLYFCYLAYSDLHGRRISKTLPAHYMNSAQWQLLFIRMYIGYNTIPHFTEKLFAGVGPRAADIAGFTGFGLANPVIFVFMAGLIEFGGAFSISCGFLTRIGSFAFFIYLFVATVIGGHFSKGFMWGNPDGGWEYPVLWAALVLSFGFFAPYKFSIDMYLQKQFKLPKWIKILIGESCFSKIK